MYPDDVVSARQFDGFCQELQNRGWHVEARPCSRGCRDETKAYPQREVWDGIELNRVWRPRFRQNSNLGRVLNALWMIAAWSKLAFRSRATLPDVVVVGTDPILSVLVASVVKRLRPSVKIAHWCHDLYPEAAVAGGVLRDHSLVDRVLTWLFKDGYRHCDLIVDLGSCMRARLDAYRPTCQRATLSPWALSEPDEILPPDTETRTELFGADASLGLLYSGNFGRAHAYEEYLTLARALRDSRIRFSFCVRGNRVDELRAAVRPDDSNVSFGSFTSEAQLPRRLAAADIHLVSLRPEWTGVVVPSKFFGCLAAGRPVLFLGGRDSCIAGWIEKYGVGWVLTPENRADVAAQLRSFESNPEALVELRARCFKTYRDHFCRSSVMGLWDERLRALLKPAAQNGSDSPKA